MSDVRCHVASHRAPVGAYHRPWALALILAALSVWMASAVSTAQDIRWLRQFGTTTRELAVATTVDDSGVYVAGHTDGTLAGQVSAGGRDAFVSKYAHDGMLLWTRQFGTPSTDQAIGVFVTTSGLYVIGQTSGALAGEASLGSGDVFVRKYDTTGNVLWTRQFGTSCNDQGIAIVTDDDPAIGDDPGVYVSGFADCALPNQTSSGGADVFLRKYSLDGFELWTRQFGTNGIDIGHAVGVDDTGIYVAGWYGYQSSPDQAFVRKYDKQGTSLWFELFGSASHDEVRGLAVDATALYVGGGTSGSLPGESSAGGTDGYLQKRDPVTGSIIWTRQFGTPANDGVFSVAIGAQGIYVTDWTLGAFEGATNAGGWDAYVRLYGDDGSVKWTVQFGSSGDDRSHSVAAYGNDAFLAGYAYGALPGQTWLGNYDAFLLKIGPPNHVPVAEAGPDQVVEATGPLTSVTLNGAGSWDPDGDPLSYKWKDANGTVVGTSPSVTVSLGLGAYAFSLSVDDGQGGTSVDTVSVTVQDTTPPAITVQAPTSTNYLLNQAVAAQFACSDLASAVVECTGSVGNGAPIATSTVGSLTFTVTARDAAGNATTHTVPYTVSYSTGMCLGAPGHMVLQPVNPDGTSVFRHNRTVPVKFRVCDANGVSIGTPGLVSDFVLFKVTVGTMTTEVNEPAMSTTPDTTFRWAADDAQWIFNLATGTLAQGATYLYRIQLNDGSVILFQFGLR